MLLWLCRWYQQAAPVSGPPLVATFTIPSLFPSSFYTMSILLAQEAALDSVALSPASVEGLWDLSVVAAVVSTVVSPVSLVYAELLGPLWCGFASNFCDSCLCCYI